MIPDNVRLTDAAPTMDPGPAIDAGHPAFDDEGTPSLPAGPVSEAEYLRWDLEGFWSEWVDGRAVLMEPPTFENNRICMFLLCLIRGYVDERDAGHVFRGSYQLRLGEPPCRYSPDLYFVAGEWDAQDRRAQRYQFAGAPELVIEVVGPDSVSRDYRTKFLAYESAGVGEYWIVDPLSQRFEPYVRHDGRFTLAALDCGVFRSRVLPGLFVRPTWLFTLDLPKVRHLLRLYRWATTAR